MAFAGFGHGLQMMAVTFLLQGIEVVINGQAIAHQHSRKILAQHAQGHSSRTALVYDVKGHLRSGKDPQPPARPPPPPPAPLPAGSRPPSRLPTPPF